MPLQSADVMDQGGGAVANRPMPGSDVAGIAVNPRCYLCATETGLSYCSFCKKYFCAGCERDYPGRVIAATLEGFSALKTFLSNALPAEPAAMPKDVPPTPKDVPPKSQSCCGRRFRRD
jgi:hypothetical protein